MISRFPSKLFQTVTKYRSLTQATATLRLSSNRAQQVQCSVEGAPYYSVMVPKSVGCALAGRDLGSQPIKVDLIFYGGCYFAYSIALARPILLVPDSQTDNFTETPRLTLTHEVASLFDSHDGAEMPAVLFHGGNNEGSAITLKGSEGEEMWDFTAIGARIFNKALQGMR